MPTCNKISEQSTIEKSRSTYSISSSTCSLGDSERSDAISSKNKTPVHNIPLDNLSRKLSTASVKRNFNIIESNIESIQKPQSAQILVPSALNLNAPLQPTLPQPSLGNANKQYSDVGNMHYILIYFAYTY